MLEVAGIGSEIFKSWALIFIDDMHIRDGNIILLLNDGYYSRVINGQLKYLSKQYCGRKSTSPY